MKRIVCIGIVLGTLLMASNAFCGTDDSGLQVFTLNGADMMGETADVGQEDTKISQYSYNMFQSGNGLCSYPRPKGYGTEFNGVPEQTTKGTYNFVKLNNIGGPFSSEVYLHNFPPYSLGTRTLILSNVYAQPYGDLFTFHGLNKDYLFVGNKLVYSTDGWSTTVEVTIPAIGKRCALWQNRFWYSGTNSPYTIYYSAAQDYENFTNSATAGGTTNIFGCSFIKKMVATQYALYIFTDTGIFAQSGPSKGWTITKISDLVLPDYEPITTLNDTVLFRSLDEEGHKVWQLSGTSFNVFCEIPDAAKSSLYSTMQVVNSGKLLILANRDNVNSFVYDTVKKSWTRSIEYNVLGNNTYFIKKTSATKYAFYYLPMAEQFNAETDIWTSSYLTPLAWGYKTAWMTLDGNASNRKEIDRIEFDYLGGTTAVYLYYAYGTGSNPASSTTITAPLTSRLTTYVWNAPIGKQQSNRFYIDFYSNGTQTMTTNYILKQIRIYYRNIGNYKTNTLR